MTTKLKKSNIHVFGKMTLSWNDGTENFRILELKGLKQSKSGVYCLRNKLNGRLYIGMARNLEVRMKRHWNDLLLGKHCSKALQEDFDTSELTPEQLERMGKHPKDLFEFEVIIYCYPSQLTFWEGLLIDNLKPYYNVKKKKEIEFIEPERIDLSDPAVSRDISIKHWNSIVGDENDC